MPRFIPNTGFGQPLVEHVVQRLEHEAVAAQRDQRFAPRRRRPSVAPAEHRFGRLGDLGGRGQQADASAPARSVVLRHRAAWPRQRSIGAPFTAKSIGILRGASTVPLWGVALGASVSERAAAQSSQWSCRSGMASGPKSGQAGVGPAGPAPAAATRRSARERHRRISRSKFVFQPQIEPVTGEVAGAEALARWDRVAGARAAVRARRRRRPRRAPVAARPAQGVARRSGLGRAAAALAHLDQPACRDDIGARRL